MFSRFSRSAPFIQADNLWPTCKMVPSIAIDLCALCLSSQRVSVVRRTPYLYTSINNHKQFTHLEACLPLRSSPTLPRPRILPHLHSLTLIKPVRVNKSSFRNSDWLGFGSSQADLFLLQSQLAQCGCPRGRETVDSYICGLQTINHWSNSNYRLYGVAQRQYNCTIVTHSAHCLLLMIDC